MQVSFQWTRRGFWRCAAVTAGFVAYRRVRATIDAWRRRNHGARYARWSRTGRDPDLPGRLKRLAAGDEMPDGLFVPGLPDAMAAFAGDNGRTLVVRNHEALFANDGPFGKNNERLSRVPASKLYDYGRGKAPCPGGTTTFVGTRARSRW
jgi:hypothetical protein